MKEKEDINISGNFVIYSSPCAYLGGHPLISSQPDCFIDTRIILLFWYTQFVVYLDMKSLVLCKFWKTVHVCHPLFGVKQPRKLPQPIQPTQCVC